MKMQEFLKIICTIVLAVCVCIMIYSIVNAINTSKRNKQTDEATRKMFIAQMAQNTKNVTTDEQPKAAFKHPTTIKPSRPKQLDYDKFEVDEEATDIGDQSLTDFFHKKH